MFLMLRDVKDDKRKGLKSCVTSNDAVLFVQDLVVRPEPQEPLDQLVLKVPLVRLAARVHRVHLVQPDHLVELAALVFQGLLDRLEELEQRVLQDQQDNQAQQVIYYVAPLVRLALERSRNAEYPDNSTQTDYHILQGGLKIYVLVTL